MNKPGRPKKGNTRTQHSLYLTKAEVAAIDQVRGEIERSTWIRQAIEQRLERRG